MTPKPTATGKTGFDNEAGLHKLHVNLTCDPVF